MLPHQDGLHLLNGLSWLAQSTSDHHVLLEWRGGRFASSFVDDRVSSTHLSSRLDCISETGVSMMSEIRGHGFGA